MKKIVILIIIIILLVVIIGGYFWWQKNQTIIPESGKALCDSLKDIPSVDFAPENVKQRFLECFPERAMSAVPSAPNIPSTPPAAEIPTEQEPACEQLKDIPSAQYAPPNVRDKFLKCFPERK
ncbi:MAG: hypothetical protein Q7J30_02255 [Candidatus Azambacteria bacterium]|nr:hypothetical protein [Candidatus Azambacteria bacterium]